MPSAGEPNRRARLRRLCGELQAVEFSSLRVDYHSARVLDGFLDTTGARNVLLLSSVYVLGTGHKTHHQHGERCKGLCHRGVLRYGMVVTSDNARQSPRTQNVTGRYSSQSLLPSQGRNPAPSARPLCDRHRDHAPQQLLNIPQRERIAKVPSDGTKDDAGFGLPYLKIAGRVIISRFFHVATQPP